MEFPKKSLKLEISSHPLTHSLTHPPTHSLPDHSRKPGAQTKQWTATILWHNNKLTSEMILTHCSFYHPLGSSSSSCSKTMLIFSNQHFPWAVYLDTTSILKLLCYSRGIGQVQIWYFECKLHGRGWQHRYIRGLVAVILSLSLQPHFDGSKLNFCHLLAIMQRAVMKFPWQQSRLTHPNRTVTQHSFCIATCYN